jgi:hypothetical protein
MHSSLLRKFVNYGRKKFYSTGSRVGFGLNIESVYKKVGLKVVEKVSGKVNKKVSEKGKKSVRKSVIN